MRRTILLLAVLALVIAGCGGGDDISIDGQWARSSPQMADAGAVYMNVTSAGGDRILSASVDPSVAAGVEIHETVPVGGETDEQGMAMMKMQPVDAIDLPAGKTVSLAPGGYHIMLIGLTKPLEAGQKFNVTVNFEKYGEKTVEVEVRDQAP
jgi:copper(I)-binding protein